MKVIGFCGPAGSGKDTCGAFLIENYGFQRLSFAAPIYDMLEIMGMGRPKTQDEKEAIIDDLGCSWRHMAQTLGTEWGRALVHQDLWIILAKRKVLANPDKNYVITDVRFENEAAMIREVGGLVVHLTGRKAEMTAATQGHASEGGLQRDYRDEFITNGGSMQDLHELLNCKMVGPWGERLG